MGLLGRCSELFNAVEDGFLYRLGEIHSFDPGHASDLHQCGTVLLKGRNLPSNASLCSLRNDTIDVLKKIEEVDKASSERTCGYSVVLSRQLNSDHDLCPKKSNSIVLRLSTPLPLPAPLPLEFYELKLPDCDSSYRGEH